MQTTGRQNAMLVATFRRTGHVMQVENEVVGAPCGVMDQMAAAVGEADALLCLTCQPAQLHPALPIPSGIRFWALDSGTGLPLMIFTEAVQAQEAAVCSRQLPLP